MMKDVDLAMERYQVNLGSHLMKPRVHPNGFIQLDLQPGIRLHVWPDGHDLPRQATVNTIHDHKFDMISTVLCGELNQLPYSIRPTQDTPTHEVYTAKSPTQDTRDGKLYPTGRMVELIAHPRQVIGVGQSYTQQRHTFHDTVWNGLTATLMHKTNVDETYNPRILCPINQAPDNDYDRWMASDETLWHYIHRALKSARV